MALRTGAESQDDVKLTSGAESQDVLQSARHVIFVEGNEEGLDVTVIEALLSPKLRVKPLGSSLSVRSAAQALRAHHPEYYFIIDRDELDDELVEASWTRFPDPSADNLLIWRRKELESYLLEPDWVCQSRYLNQDADRNKLAEWITREANTHIDLHTANRVIIALRHQIKNRDGGGRDLFKEREISGLDLSHAQIVARIAQRPLLTQLPTRLAALSAHEALTQCFQDAHQLLTGGQVPLRWDTGRWRDLIPAKTLFRSMVNLWFTVPDRANPEQPLKGRAAERALVADLLLNHREQMPQDLHDLRRLTDQIVARMT